MIRNRFLGSILLITGTCVGAGMLGLPISTSPLGLGLSLLVIIAVWALMCFTGLLVLEVTLWFKEDVSYISMADKTLGSWGRRITWATFLLLLYALMVAYFMAGNALLGNVLQSVFGVQAPLWAGIVPWVVVLGLLIVAGAHAVDVTNKLLMIGLCLAFAAMAAVIVPHIHTHINTDMHPRFIIASLPVVLTSFGYHIIIPTVSAYVKRDVRALRKIIIIGSVLPLLVYILWQWLVFSLLPQTGEHSLQAILNSGDAAGELTEALSFFAGSTMVSLALRFFIFFAVATSFIGVSMGLFDLLLDGLSMKGRSVSRLSVASLTIFPPIIFVLYYPQGFLMALGYGGVFVAILHGILPALMAWRGRPHHSARFYQVVGGRLALALVILFSLVVIYAQVAATLCLQ